MSRTLAEKILLAHTDADDLAPGDFVMVRCDVVMANDLSTPHVAREIARMGASRAARRPNSEAKDDGASACDEVNSITASPV